MTRLIETESAANKGSVEKKYQLAILYLFGHGVEKDVSKGVETLSDADLEMLGAAQFLQAMVFLGAFRDEYIDPEQAKNAAFAGAALNDEQSILYSHMILVQDAFAAMLRDGKNNPERVFALFRGGEGDV